MSETLLANLFFIIVGSVVLAVGALLFIVIYRLLKIIKMVRHTLERIHTSTELIVEDVQSLHRQISDGSVVGRVVAAFISGVSFGVKKGKTSKKKRDINNQT